jgi:hypothetical protein
MAKIPAVIAAHARPERGSVFPDPGRAGGSTDASEGREGGTLGGGKLGGAGSLRGAPESVALTPGSERKGARLPAAKRSRHVASQK